MELQGPPAQQVLKVLWAPREITERQALPVHRAQRVRMEPLAQPAQPALPDLMELGEEPLAPRAQPGLMEQSGQQVLRG